MLYGHFEKILEQNGMHSAYVQISSYITDIFASKLYNYRVIFLEKKMLSATDHFSVSLKSLLKLHCLFFRKLRIFFY